MHIDAELIRALQEGVKAMMNQNSASTREEAQRLLALYESALAATLDTVKAMAEAQRQLVKASDQNAVRRV